MSSKLPLSQRPRKSEKVDTRNLQAMFNCWSDTHPTLDSPAAIEGNGHDTWQVQQALEPMPMPLFSRLTSADDDELERLFAAWKSKTPLPEPIALGALYHSECTYCEVKDWSYDGFTLQALQPCPNSHCINVEVELDVPSGQLVVANDLRELFPAPENHDINRVYGLAQTTHSYAEHGPMLHFFVGNTCPSLFPAGENAFLVASCGYDEETDADIDVPGVSGESVATVCTDLWWVSIADAGIARSRGLKTLGNYETIIDVEPGRWRLTYYGCRKDFDRDSNRPIIYADLVRIS